MIKQNWKISEEEKSRIIDLHESSTKKLYLGKLINEQQKEAASIVGKTDASRMSHAGLAKFGLPDGAKHENYYYFTDGAKILNMAKSDDESKYLSIFQPSNEYNEDKKMYMDYVQFGDDDTNSLEGSGSKVFQLNDGNVFATHNGLLALFRVIQGLHKNQIFYKVPVTIQFGTHTGEEADKRSERGFETIKLNAGDITKLAPVVRGLQQQIALLAVKDYKKTTLYPDFNIAKNDLIAGINNILKNDIMGVGKFIPIGKKDEVIKNLIPKGFITTLKTDLNTPFSKLVQISSLDDITYPEGLYGMESKRQVNPEKLKQVAGVGKSYQDALYKEYKESYIHNLKLFVENYVPNNKDFVDGIIPTIDVPIIDLGYEFNKLFTSTFGPGTPTRPTEYKTDSQKSKVGG